MSLSGRARKSLQCSRGSRAHATGAQQVLAIVATTGPLGARRRDFSSIEANEARRRGTAVRRRTQNGWLDDEYWSAPAYSSRTGSHTLCTVRVS